MNLLTFINTNHGVAAVRRHILSENLHFTQVWFRTEPGEWKKYHFFIRGKDFTISSEMLEALYKPLENKDLPYEDWW